MQTADGFGLDSGPSFGAAPPPGSRLAKYLGGNRTSGSSSIPVNTNVSHLVNLFSFLVTLFLLVLSLYQVPTFIPQFAQFGLNDMQQPPPCAKQAGSHSPFSSHRSAPPFHLS
uniref:Transmembrane protein n=1 Tax=Angiostrongylus cantonensis TaxID=6313 RepID=A0A0K0DRR4_ANGCA